MASLSPQGERTVLALLAEQYAEVVELRIALDVERQGRAEDAQRYEAEIARLTAEPPATIEEEPCSVRPA